MRKTLLLFCMITGVFLWDGLVAQSTHEDEPHVRSFNQEHIDTYKENSDYLHYDSSPTHETNRLLAWLTDKLKTYFDGVTPDGVASVLRIIVKVVLWLLGLFAIFMIVFTLFKANISVVQRPDTSVALNYQQLEENFETDWNSLIEDSINARQFNVAIRLLFLQTIQHLHQRKCIVWEKDKTNYDYLRELGHSDLRLPFGSLVSYYNFGWFGDYTIEEAEFAEIQQQFSTFNTSVD